MHLTSVVSTLALGLAVASAASIPSVDAFKVPVDGSVPSANETEPFTVVIDAKKYTVKVNEEPPNDGSVCPETDNGKYGTYPSHTYTQNQLTAAFKTGATNQANGKTLGANDYPHAYGNSEGFTFSCAGKQYEEFPIQTNGQTYDGGATTSVPDRVIYAYKIKGEYLLVNYCGTIRHGPGNNFLQCSA